MVRCLIFTPRGRLGRPSLTKTVRWGCSCFGGLAAAIDYDLSSQSIRPSSVVVAGTPREIATALPIFYISL